MMIDFAQMLRKKTMLNKAPFSMAHLLSEVLDHVHTKVESQGVDVLVMPCLSTPHYVFGDRSKVLQILSFVLDNSIRFSRPGGQVYVRLKSLDPERASQVPLRPSCLFPLLCRPLCALPTPSLSPHQSCTFSVPFLCPPCALPCALSLPLGPPHALSELPAPPTPCFLNPPPPPQTQWVGHKHPQPCIRMAVHRRRKGFPPPGPPPLLPFQCSRLTAKILLQCLRCQEDLALKFFRPSFGGDHRGTQGGGMSPPNPPAPPPPSNTSLPPPTSAGFPPRKAHTYVHPRSAKWHSRSALKAPPASHCSKALRSSRPLALCEACQCQHGRDANGLKQLSHSHPPTIRFPTTHKCRMWTISS